MAYVGYITQIKNVRKHSNADRLQLGECFGNTVVVGLEYVNNQIGVYFPVDGQLSEEFCQVNDLVRRKDEDGKSIGGYLDPNKRNIKAIRLRGEKSDGLFLPLTCLANFTKISDLKIGDTIDVLNGVEICKKYIPVVKSHNSYHIGGSCRARADYAPTFYEHVDTQQLAYNLDTFKNGDIVELTLKMHGTSGRTGYVPVIKTKKQNLLEKILRRPGKKYTEYEYVTGTRRVVLDSNAGEGFYGDNLFRLQMAKKFEGKLHKGEIVYYEIVGFVNKDTPIMASVQNNKVSDKFFTKQYGPVTVFSYGCNPDGDWEETFHSAAPDVLDFDEVNPPRCQVYVYRMVMVNEDGDIVEMSPDQMRYRCNQMGVKYVPVFERFVIPDLVQLPDDVGSYQEVNPGEYVLRKVEEYFDGPDPIGKTHIREGVVARIVNRPNIAVYKHKNFNFKVLEGIVKDEAIAPDIEEEQEVIKSEE